MKKLIVFLMAMLMVMAMAIPAHAVTPSVDVPKVPQVSGIKFDIKVELPEGFWAKWFEDHPIKP